MVYGIIKANMKKLIIIILVLISGVSLYAQNPVYGKKVVGLDSLVADTIRARTQDYPYFEGLQSGRNEVDTWTIDGSTIINSGASTISGNGTINLNASTGTLVLNGASGIQASNDLQMNDNDISLINELTADTVNTEKLKLFGVAEISTGSLLDITMKTNDVDALILESDQDIYIPNGNLNINSNKLSNVGSSTDSDSFYETGTFTPVVADASTGGNTATGTFGGSYTRIGNLCFIQIELVNINTSGMTAGNDLFVRSLPFTSANNSRESHLNVNYDNLNISPSAIEVQGEIGSNVSYMFFRDSRDNGTRVITIVSDVTSGTTDLRISGVYMVQ